MIRRLLDRLARHPALLRVVLVGCALAVPMLLAHPALARAGGGGGFGGGSSGGSGGSGGGGGAIVELILWLVIRHPRIGIPVAVVAVVIYVVNQKSSSKRADWSTSIDWSRAAGLGGAVSPRRALTGLVAEDPDFSLVLFEDFLYTLYAKVEEARGKGDLDPLSGYLSEAARRTLAATAQGLKAVEGVVVGGMKITSVVGMEKNSPGVTVSVAFDTNYTEVRTDGSKQAYFTSLTWQLFRRHGVRSRPPDRARTIDCPNCGAALDETHGGVCAYCGMRVDTGGFDWMVAGIQVFAREPRKPGLLGDEPERGTDLPTIKDDDAQSRLTALRERDPAFDWSAFEARVRLIHDSINAAWTKRDWASARAFVSDTLFQMEQYWIDAYKSEGLTNVLENMRVERVELVRVDTDKYFDAITVRMYGTGLDYTVRDTDQKVVGGSRHHERRYSEYWTLIRGVGTRGKAAHSKPVCPNCGAPLDKISMAGECEYCGATVTTGEFDWVLSHIEQDEAYDG